MVINNNQAGLAAATLLAGSSARLEQSLARLSSGSKISSSADDSGGLAVSTQVEGQLARLNGVANNIGDAISYEQTQDGYLARVSDALNRMGELTVLAMDPTKSASDRLDYNKEYQQLGTDPEDTGKRSFNGVPLFDAGNLNVTIDADGNTFTLNNISAGGFTLFTGHDGLVTLSDTQTSLAYLKTAIATVASYRARVGSNEQALTYYNNQAATLKNNLDATNSRITDVDVAQETVNYARANILVQSGTAMLAQANLQPQSVLKLLG